MTIETLQPRPVSPREGTRLPQAGTTALVPGTKNKGAGGRAADHGSQPVRFLMSTLAEEPGCSTELYPGLPAWPQPLPRLSCPILCTGTSYNCPATREVFGEAGTAVGTSPYMEEGAETQRVLKPHI